MSPERWQRIEEVFQMALDLPQAERRGFIVGVCAGDEALREHVEALVAQHEAAGDFIEAPAIVDYNPSADSTPSEIARAFTDADDKLVGERIGERIGAYRLVREVGRGGMGAVYLAERADSAFNKLVAIK